MIAPKVVMNFRRVAFWLKLTELAAVDLVLCVTAHVPTDDRHKATFRVAYRDGDPVVQDIKTDLMLREELRVKTCVDPRLRGVIIRVEQTLIE